MNIRSVIARPFIQNALNTLTLTYILLKRINSITINISTQPNRIQLTNLNKKRVKPFITRI